MKRETAEMLERVKTQNYGHLHEADVEILAGDPATRLSLLLVRCGGGRFLAPADQVLHFVAIIEASKADHVRDISLPSNFTIAGESPAQAI